ncbi:hypothetical protein BKA62DRAFT_830916 [Auriculariales sp. MPI-PUGE-AT-0066]|nr:hypothetical protein BKA62DRAFT_830916 [Auriculariales sp. MPI-PUGE-AT-0066]
MMAHLLTGMCRPVDARVNWLMAHVHTTHAPPPPPGQQQQKLQWKGLFGRDKKNDAPAQQVAYPGELTRMIGYLTGFAADDWTVILEVCQRATANEANAREAAKALRRELKSAEPSAQMATARLWAIMLRYSSEIFIGQTCTKTFLETVEEVCTSNKTTPAVRERLLEVVAGAAYAHPSSGRDGFAGAWRRVKHPSQPEEGIPFNEFDPMFTPPAPKTQRQPPAGYAPQHAPHPSYDRNVYPDGAVRQRNHSGGGGGNGGLTTAQQYPVRYGHLPTQQQQQQYAQAQYEAAAVVANGGHAARRREQRMSTDEEEIRTLYDQCEVARNNARLLGEAVIYTKPLELGQSTVIKEFYAKCMASQEFIVAQIRWATAHAKRSREKLQEALSIAVSTGKVGPETQPQTETPEELLLGAILAANQELTDAFEQYQELERMRQNELEKNEVALRSITEVRLDRTVRGLPGPRLLHAFPASVVEESQSGSPVSAAGTLRHSPSMGSSIRSVTPPSHYSSGYPEQLHGLGLEHTDALRTSHPPRPGLLEPSSSTSPPSVRNSARASMWTIDTIQSAPSNRTVVSPDWESVPLPDIANEEEETLVPEPPVTPPIPSPPQVPLLTSLEDLPQWKDQITTVARLLVCDGFLTRAGTPVEPAKVRLAPDYQNFALYQSTREHIERHRDASRRAIELVTSNLDPNLLAALRPIVEKDEHQAWELMEALDRRATYRRERVARRRMMDRLIDMRYEDGSDMRLHITAVRAVLDPLATVEMSHGVKAMLLLSSLPRTPEWESFKDDLLSSTTDDAALTLDDVESALLRRSGSA